MTALAETGRLVPVVETCLAPLSGKIPIRVGQKESLDPSLLRQSFLPQLVVAAGEVGNPWSIAQTLSPYVSDPREIHVVIIDTSDPPRYLPDLHRVPFEEGCAVMGTVGRIVAFMEQRTESHFVQVGISWSPRGYGEEEARGGYQSLTSTVHIHALDRVKDPEKFVAIEELPEGTQRALQGDNYKRLVCELLLKPMLERYGSQFIKPSSIKVDNRSVIASLTADRLSDLLKNPVFFEFLQRFEAAYDQVARDVTEATTFANFSAMDEVIRSAFEHGTNGVYPMLSEPLLLRPPKERERRIAELEEKGYPREFVGILQRLNRSLENRKEGREKSWVRKGFALATLISGNLKTGEVELRVSPGIFVRERGGPVETGGIALIRRGVAEATPEELSLRLAGLRRLKAYLAETM